MSDSISHLDAAEAMAMRLKEYWAKQGHQIRTWVETKENPRDHRRFYSVQSTLVNGLPPRG